MRKYLIVIVCVLLAPAFIYAQDSLALQKHITQKPPGPVPLIVIKGEEFKRFPSGNFLDAVNGLFPWVFSQAVDANNFLFVVNGFLLSDINSISLYDIEEVSFSIGSLNGSLYPFSKAGTFYITTRKFTGGKVALSFNSQYNLISDKGRSVTDEVPNEITTQTSKNTAGYSLGNHASVMAGGKKWELYASAQLDQLTTPTSSDTIISTIISRSEKDSTVIHSMQKRVNFRSFGQFTYRYSTRLNLGITGSYFHGQANRDTALSYFQPAYKSEGITKVKATLPYYLLGAFVSWVPLHNLSNRISFEYATDKLNDDGDNSTNLLQPGNAVTGKAIDETTLHSRRLLVRDEMKYVFLAGAKFQSGVTAIFSYLNQNADYKYMAVFTNSSGVIASRGSNQYYNEKLTSLNPGFYFSYNKIVSGYAGYAFLLNKRYSSFTAASKQNPYAGLVFDIKNMIKAGKKLNRLDLSLDYSNLTRNDDNNNWLPGIANPSQFFPSPIISFATAPGLNSIPNPYLGNTLLKNRLISVEANAAFFNNRLMIGSGWRELRSDNVYFYTVNGAGGPNLYLAQKGSETQKGVDVHIAGKVVDQLLKTWILRLNMLLLPQATYQVDFTGGSGLSSLKDRMQVSLQNNISYKKWYVQLSGLMALNKKTANTFLLNYLLVGYKFSGRSNSLLQKLSLFAQARNLLSSGPSKDYYGYYSYAGAGLNIAF